MKRQNLISNHAAHEMMTASNPHYLSGGFKLAQNPHGRGIMMGMQADNVSSSPPSIYTRNMNERTQTRVEEYSEEIES